MEAIATASWLTSDLKEIADLFLRFKFSGEGRKLVGFYLAQLSFDSVNVEEFVA